MKDEMFRKVTDAIGCPFFIFNSAGEVMYTNRAGAGMLDRNTDQITGKLREETDVLFPEHQLKHISDAVTAGASLTVDETWDAAGTRQSIESTYLPVNLSTDCGEWVLWTWKTRAVPTNSEKILFDALVKFREMNALIRHDILNQLTIMIGFLQFSEDMIEDLKVREFIKKEITAAEKVQRQIEFTREYQEIAGNMPCWIDLGQAVRDALGEGKDADYTIEPGLEEYEVFTFPILQKFIGGILRDITFSPRNVTGVRLGHRISGGNLTLTIGDNGGSIPPDKRELLFEREWVSETANGFFLAREFLPALGFSIAETGSPESGARIEIRIPAGYLRTKKIVS
jgi:Histidine kinase-, DNA gyrase B-, and HSP90-like ATPase.